jgi:hypothetical protein
LDIDEIFLPDDNDSNREINQNDEDKVNSNELEHLQEEKDNIFNDPKENSNNIYDTPKESFNNENYTNL